MYIQYTYLYIQNMVCSESLLYYCYMAPGQAITMQEGIIHFGTF